MRRARKWKSMGKWWRGQTATGERRNADRQSLKAVFQVNLTFSVSMTDDLTWTKKNDL